jgi:hypothetical protein
MAVAVLGRADHDRVGGEGQAVAAHRARVRYAAPAVLHADAAGAGQTSLAALRVGAGLVLLPSAGDPAVRERPPATGPLVADDARVDRETTHVGEGVAARRTYLGISHPGLTQAAGAGARRIAIAEWVAGALEARERLRALCGALTQHSGRLGLRNIATIQGAAFLHVARATSLAARLRGRIAGTANARIWRGRVGNRSAASPGATLGMAPAVLAAYQPVGTRVLISARERAIQQLG